MFNWCLLNFLQCVTGLSSSISFFLNVMNILKKWSHWCWWMSLWIGLVSSSWYCLVCSFISQPSCKLVVKFKGYDIQIKKKLRVFYRRCCVLLIASHQEAHTSNCFTQNDANTNLVSLGVFSLIPVLKFPNDLYVMVFVAVNDDCIVPLFFPH